MAVSLVGERERPLLRTVAKHAKGAATTQKGASSDDKNTGLQARAVPAPVISHFLSKIRSLEVDVADIFKQERTEKELRVAEMEANKASNLMKHASEIQHRPARSWFQTEKEKKDVKNRVRARDSFVRDLKHCSSTAV